MISATSRPEGAPSQPQAVTAPPASRVVVKPVPKAQHDDPRTYQLNQLRKRYSPKESTVDNGAATSLVFKLAPSDPDFPFELDHLECDLRVPKNYPKEGSPPRLTVLNKDMPRGFAINVEKGWSQLVEERKGATLLALTNALDKHLEAFLSEQKAETVKVTIYKDTRHISAAAPDVPQLTSQSASSGPVSVPVSVPVAPSRPFTQEETYTKEQIAEAKARRAQETRQIETRMGRLSHYHKSSDGIVYTLSLEPKRRSELPAGLRGVNSLQLIVPILYPLQPLRILLNDADSEDAEPVEELFAEKAREKKELTLMSHVNLLTQSIHVLAKQAQSRQKSVKPVAQDAEEATATVSTEDDAAKISDAIETGKGNVQVIPRPPEWYTDAEADHTGEDSYESTDSSEDEEGGAAVSPEQQPSASSLPSQTSERGTAISFPSVELHGIELLQVSILSIGVKCDRCKTINEIGGLKPNTAKTNESCRKCATPFTVTFRPELVHASSTRAGFLDATGCTVSDMLPSTFIPTCGKCSTPTAQGLVAVRGDTTTNVCRECHARFTFKIPEVKFLAYSPGSGVLPPTSGPRRRQEKLGLHAGEPLPNKGACKHYRKSYRWFRFSCCNKVYPCDHCHEEAEDHINEWANRMICGWCSREQNYAVTNCTFCGRSVVGRRGRGFWEGGKGTRDQRLMSRKDPRKYKRIGGVETKKGE
ncbi:hypothetical protein M406DRAFT_334032 [Cryphonectria parasitica EP155]|uniref:CHY-type domain-containing protein n=1 Tax=Cryphonectria parasitica (strain ATCC 38755 / EP155) TaxID=660469 RepID=A0A9P4XW46_CRYP1|nr:uncharacterized protein M406DRAFT_334032 [Cryphonectria parasitica EP155]KAF3761993.1 hypothetical protein M406DRAFT_334032 [Cryphonectria parasitica EP155]